MPNLAIIAVGFSLGSKSMNFSPRIWKSYCPVCNIENNVYIFDDGIKLWLRLIVGNNRFACRNCKVTWRRKKPDSYVGFAGRSHKIGTIRTYTQVKSLPYRIILDSINNLKKNFLVYCSVGMLAAVVAYLLIGAFPSDFQKFIPKQKKEIQNTVAPGGNNMNGRNDKMAGKKELLRLGNGKKNW